MEELAIVFTVFGSIFGMVFVVTYFLTRHANHKLDALVKITEQGGELRPELLERLSAGAGPAADLRKGLIWLAIGIPLTVGIALNEGWDEALFGSIPVFIGLAYLVVMVYGQRRAG